MQPSGFDMEQVVSRLTEKVYALLAALPMFVVALVIVWAAWATGGWLGRRALLHRSLNRNPFLRDLARTTVRWLTALLGLVIALDLLDATAVVSAMLGTAGVLGVALGFAFKETLENYLAGILMSIRQPFSPQDEVEIDGHSGAVIAMTSRATILMTLDGNHLRIPNAVVFRSVMLNYTRNPSRRFEFDVGIGVQEDLVQAQLIGVAQLNALDGVMVKPPPRAFIYSLGDSNVQVRYFGWVDQTTHDFWLVRGEAIRAVKTALETAGLDLPEPIYRLQIRPGSAPSVQAAVLTEREAASAREVASGSRSAGADISSEAPAVVMDTTRTEDLDEKLAGERAAASEINLLDDQAPKE